MGSQSYCFILILVAIFSLSASKKQICSTILFKNVGEYNMPWVQIEGVYTTRISTIHDDFPVYKSEKSGLYFYYSYDPSKRIKMLAFGQEVGGTVFGLVASVSTNFDPKVWLASGNVNKNDVFGEITKDWFYYFPLDETFKKVYSAKKIKAVCVEDESIQCDSGKLYLNDTVTSGSVILNDPKIDYFKKLTDIYTSMRPVYKHSRRNWYLYYKDDYWRIGTSYFSGSTEVLRVTDHALKPEYVTGMWNVWTGTEWTAAFGLTMLCRGISNGKNDCPLISLPCKNSGTCVYTKGNETVCVCKKGSYGVHCEETSICAYPGEPSSSVRVVWADRSPGEITTSFCGRGYRFQPMEFYVCEAGKGWILESKASCQAPPPSQPPTRPPLTFQPRQIPTTAMPWDPSLDFLMFFGPSLAFHLVVPTFIWLGVFIGRIIRASTSTAAGSTERIAAIAKIAGQRYWVLLRIYSAFFNLMFWPWFVFVFVCAFSDFKDNHSILMYCAMGMCGFCALFVAAEGYLCPQRAALRNIVTWDYILSLQVAAPVIEIIIKRYKLRYIKQYETDSSGYRHFVGTRKKKSNQKTVREPFIYTTWKDKSRTEISLSRRWARLDLVMDIKLADEVTENAFKAQKERLIEKSRHLNTDYDTSRQDHVPNFTPHVLVGSDVRSVPWWISEKYFWFATLCQLSWVYRAYLDHKTGFQDYLLSKTVFFKPDDSTSQTGFEQDSEDGGSCQTGAASSSGISENKPLIEFTSQANNKNYMSI